MIPEYWTFVDSIPKTSVGKYNKKAVREQLEKFLAIAKDVSHHHE